jgi:hypothetical protein
MISKLVPPLSGLTSLVTGCTIDGIARTLLLVQFPQIQNLGLHT